MDSTPTLKEASSSGRYYVYFLVHKNDVIYVGKGVGERVLQHWKNAQKGAISPLYDYMRLAWTHGEKITYSIVELADSESHAFALEAFYIRLFGRDKLLNQRSGVEHRVRIPHIDLNGRKCFIEKAEWELTTEDYQVLAGYHRVLYEKHQHLTYLYELRVREAQRSAQT